MISLLFFTSSFLLIISIYIALISNRLGSPALIWCIVWSLLFIFYALFGLEYYVEYDDLVFIIFGVALFPIGHLVGDISFRSNVSDRWTSEIPRILSNKSKIILYFLVIVSAIGFMSPMFFANKLGYSIFSMFHPSQYFETSRAIIHEMRGHGVEQGLVSKLLIAIPQSGCLISGIYFSLKAEHRKIKSAILLLPLLSFFIFTFMTTLRSFLLLSLLWMMCGYISGLILMRREHELRNPKLIAWVSIGVFSMIFSTIFLQSVRLGDFSFQNLYETLDYLRPWVAGYLPAFSQWASNYWTGELTWGAATTRGIVGTLGFAEGLGITERLESMHIGRGQVSNAMTVFKVFVGDFGLTGSLLFTFIWGMISSLLYRLVRSGSVVAMAFFSANLAAVIWSPNFWFLGYGGRLMTVALGAILLAILTIRISDLRVR